MIWPRIYLVQKVDLVRLERFNVGLFAVDPVTRSFVSRFLTDEQWKGRFGASGSRRSGASFDNWKAWRRCFDRIDDLSGILSPDIPRVSSYEIVTASERIYMGGTDPEENFELDAYADEMFQRMVL